MSIDDYMLMCERVMRQAAEDNPDASALQRVLMPPATETSLRSQTVAPTILLVENEPALLETLGERLHRSGYAVLPVASGKDALRICREHQGCIDVLLTDLLMDPVNGFEVADAVRAAFPEVIVLFMSGALIDSLPPELPRHQFFQKPFSHQELLAAIQRLTAISDFS